MILVFLEGRQLCAYLLVMSELLNELIIYRRACVCVCYVFTHTQNQLRIGVYISSKVIMQS